MFHTSFTLARDIHRGKAGVIFKTQKVYNRLRRKIREIVIEI